MRQHGHNPLAMPARGAPMCSYRLPIYLRSFRRHHGLTQDELAFLCGLKSGTQISRIEQQSRRPSATTIIACACIFSTDAADLWPRAHEEVREEVRARAEQLYGQLQGDRSRATRAKLDLLETILEADKPDGL